jgi:alkylation response protein AidB-like acyl-CoA dehydrogenase
MNTEVTDRQGLEQTITEAAAPHAAEMDHLGQFPRDAIRGLGAAGLLGLISANEVGGEGKALRQAAEVVEIAARSCGSTAMVMCMHYCATAVIEAYGPRDVREAIARDQHLTTLAFSEAGSRGHFWVPLSTAAASDGTVRLDAQKSWVTSAGEAISYVWSSKPVAAEGLSTLWLVAADRPGLTVRGPFDGLGLRGNASSPITAEGTTIPADLRLGEDGKGFDIMMGVVLPHFQVLNAAFSVGTMQAAIASTVAHLTAARYEHLGQTLADQPTARQAVARMQIRYDQARALLLDTIDAIEQGRPDAQLRVLEVKASASEAALEVTDLAMRACGGAAFRKEVGVERNFRDARAASVMAPSTDVLHDFIGKAVCGLPLF